MRKFVNALLVLMIGFVLGAAVMMLVERMQTWDFRSHAFEDCDQLQVSLQLADTLRRMADVKETCGAVPNANDYVVCSYLAPSGAFGRAKSCADLQTVDLKLEHWLEAFQPNVLKACQADLNCRTALAKRTHH